MNLPPWSATHLKDADNCLRKYAEVRVFKRVREPPTTAMDWGNEVHSAMENRLKTGAKLPQNMAQWEKFILPIEAIKVRATVLPEQQLGITAAGLPCDFFAANVFGRGKIDVPIMVGDNTACLFDWKTGKEREDPDELRLHALLLNAKFPKLTRILGSYIWLKDNRMGQMYDLSDTGATWRSVNRKYDRLKEAHDKNYWPPNQNPLCGWCPVITCEFNTKRVP